MTSFTAKAKYCHAVSKGGFAFNLIDRKWKLSRDVVVYLAWIDNFLHSDLHAAFLSLLKFYAETYSAGYTKNVSDRFGDFVKHICSKRGVVKTIEHNDIINYRYSLDREHEWHLATIRSLLKHWVELEYPGVDNDVVTLIYGWKLRGCTKGRAVQTLCPKEGSLSDIEFEALHQAITDGFETNKISLYAFVLIELVIATGRRPSQLGDLKSKDLICAQSENGLCEYVLNIPRRKQRGVWREEFKAFALAPEIGCALLALIKGNRKHLLFHVPNASEELLNEIPIFPDWKSIEKIIRTSTNKDLLFLVKTEHVHIATNHFRSTINDTISSLYVSSERTGKNLRVFPLRLRRTLATRAAREGYGELIIAELLDHTDTQNAQVYTENVPEHVDAIDEAVVRQLAPLAQAFAGVLVEREQIATRGNDLSSRIKSDSSNIGTCGHYGFCGALSPIACYTCRQFQPWLHAPHEEVLNSLIAERQKVFEITQDKAMAAINDRTILAVTQVIQQCEARNAKLIGGNSID